MDYTSARIRRLVHLGPAP